MPNEQTIKTSFTAKITESCHAYTQKLAHVNTALATHFEKVFSLISFDHSAFITCSNEDELSGFAIVNKHPNAWEVPLFHFLSRSDAEAGLPSLLNKIDSYFQSWQQHRLFAPQSIRVRFPQNLIDPHWCDLLFIQRGFHRMERVEMTVSLATILTKIKAVNKGPAQRSDLKLVSIQRPLISEVVKIAKRAYDGSAEQLLYYSDHASPIDSYRNSISKIINAEKDTEFLPNLSRIALLNGNPIGFCLAVERAHNLYIAEIAVCPSCQNQYIATQMLHEVLLQARERGYQDVQLGSLKSNTAARPFFQRLGLRAVSSQLWYIKTSTKT